MKKRLLSILLACAAIPMINTPNTPAARAAENTGGKADRTILLYDGGTTGGFGSDEHAGFINDNPMRFDLDSEGVMQTGWQEIDGERYYFDEEGVMQTGWLEIDGIWYYFSENGPLRK